MGDSMEFGSVLDAIKAGRYENRIPHSVSSIPIDEDVMTVRQAREHKEREKQRARDQLDKYETEQGRLNDLFRADLEAEYGTCGHPKAGKLYEIAWELGHSCGYTEVAYHYAELAELIAP